MSELQNPLFDEEKEFLERKKLEYERALRGDVDHIKEQTAVVGKVALVGAGLAGGIWLLTKAFGGKKRKKKAARRKQEEHREEEGRDYADFDKDDYTYDDESVKSAADSAKIFEEHHERQHEADDLDFGGGSPEPMKQTAPAAFAEQDQEADPFQDLPYDDSRRLPASHAFDEDAYYDKAQEARAAASRNSRSRMIGSVLQSFLQSDTGKVLVAQAGALALALVTKKVGEFFPAAKNSDLADSPTNATAETGSSPVASSATSDSPDASNNTQSL